MGKFSFTKANGIEYLTLKEIPFLHGFIGKDSPCDPLKLNEVLGLSRDVFALKQCHSVNYLRASEAKSLLSDNADGFLIERDSAEKGIFVIKTADCMPVIMWNEEYVALLHIGWKGAAKEFLQKVLGDIPGKFHLAVGPHALKSEYEIKEGILPEFKRVSLLTNPLRLSLADTLLMGVSDRILSVNISSISTMKDERFHSHRRDGDKAGRNLTFVAF